jgi:hypothetical protein
MAISPLGISFRRLENGSQILLPERFHFDVSEWPPEPFVATPLFVTPDGPQVLPGPCSQHVALLRACTQQSTIGTMHVSD